MSRYSIDEPMYGEYTEYCETWDELEHLVQDSYPDYYKIKDLQPLYVDEKETK